MSVRIDDVVECVEWEDVAKWAVCYKVSYVDVGEVCEDYFLESEAIDRIDTLRAAGFVGASYTVVSSGN